MTQAHEGDTDPKKRKQDLEEATTCRECGCVESPWGTPDAGDVAQAAGVTEVAVRNRSKELAGRLDVGIVP